MVTAATKSAATAQKPTPVAKGDTTPKPAPKVEPKAKAKPAPAAPVKPAVKAEAKAAPKAKEPKPKEVIPYATALAEYRDLKKAVSDDFSRLCYDARLKEPKNSKTPEEATAKVESIVAAYREFARLLNEAAPKRP